ncbi:LOW QUALITY PROTEIN: uncharacterized protein EMH_0043600 [Eimeria mitis]|uniref:Uncharacterized protein n=1 Tax=Eimeria mitis TaxID=44415 RepID=U6JVD1_9EIME|nr:LOW QUALITY PROTEIN: uncharacterized protein EMH_0043600 [Eimeria mitis]CDJ28741.1 hypothetical protein EMH_0043600 [Eimeria mitis]
MHAPARTRQHLLRQLRAVAAAAAGTASTVAAVDRRENVECGIHLNFTVTMDGGDSFDAVKAMGKAEAKVAATAVDEAGTGPAVDATRTVSRQTISRVHRTSHGIASDLAEGKEAPASAYCDVAAAALAVEDNAPDAADTETAEEAATLQAPDDALKLKAFASCAAPVAGGGPEVEHTSAASVEVARWGSSIPRMPGALREGFLAEVKSLQKKPIMKITTSVEGKFLSVPPVTGAYGESSVSSLFKLFSLLNKHFGLNEHSTFLDIGRSDLLFPGSDVVVLGIDDSAAAVRAAAVAVIQYGAEGGFEALPLRFVLQQ